METMMFKNSSLPNNWVNSRLSDIYTILESGSRPRGGVKSITEGIPSIGAEHISHNGEFNFTQMRFVPFEFASTVRRGRIEYEDILIVKDGATTGRVSFIDQDFPFISAILNEHVFRLRVNADIIEPKLLFYFLYSQVGQKMILSSFHGAAQGGINQQFINSVFISHPESKKDQFILLTRLESLLNEQMKACKLHKKIVTDTDRLMDAVLAEVFPLKEGKLPTGWRMLTLPDVCLINPARPRNITRPDSTTTSFVPMEVVDEHEGKIKDFRTRQYGEVKHGYTYFEEDDILFAKITPCMENGKTAIARNLIGGFGFGSTEFHVLRSNPNICPEWIFYFIRRQQFRRVAKLHFRGAVGQQRVPQDFLRTHFIPIPYPDNPEKSLVTQKQLIAYIGNIASQVFDIQDENQNTRTLLSQLEQSILTQAFRGEL